MYCPRILSSSLKRALSSFPAVLVTGPRQSGKTTFLRAECGQEYLYVQALPWRTWLEWLWQGSRR